MTDAPSPSALPTSRANDNPYVRLGVRPFINCCSVRTIHGGSLIRPEVRTAMTRAATQFVNIYELMEAAGRRIAELTGSEFGIVTPGSAAAVCLGTAGAVAGNDPERIARLPFTEGMRNRVLMPKGHRFTYDHAIRMVGATIHEFASVAELARMLEDPAVAMICIYGRIEGNGPVPIEDIVKLARPKNVPVMVDAASEHIERPCPWLVRGADMVIYSGGKFLQGPQVSGVLFGRERSIRAAWANASPHQGIGRPMKVSKEDIIGVVSALEHWFDDRDHAAERVAWQADLETIARKVTAVRGVETRIHPPAGSVKVPLLEVSWAQAGLAVGALELRQRLLDGEPRIMLDDCEVTATSITVDPFNMVSGEAELVGDAMVRALTARAATAPVAAPAVDVAGTWELSLDLADGPVVHRLVLTQDGGTVGGRHQSRYLDDEVSGSVGGDRLTVQALHRYEGCLLGYGFEGTVA
ncbi:MAG TPA: aminotransferase class V-fold PLP-dependent enzyme, partial [Acetobacteraceae bacterium]|nr:aminotransferase class V-fold PLP-dependent enzyme [Acetobacteraceae bacterium]